MNEKRENIVIGAILLTFASGYAYMTTQLPTRDMPNTVGVDFMPWVFCIFLASMSVLLIVSGIVRRPSDGDAPRPTRVRLTRSQIRGVVILFTIFVVYIALIDVVGFLLVTPPAMFALMYLEGVRRYSRMAVIAIVSTLVIYGLFRYVFEVSIPGIAFL